MTLSVGEHFKSDNVKGCTMRVDLIKTQENILEVTIFRNKQSRWQEKWNLQHTVWGMNRGAYIFIEPSDSNENKEVDDDPLDSPHLGVVI